MNIISTPQVTKENRRFPRVLVIGASPDVTNPNAHLRCLLTSAFQDTLSKECVRSATFEEGSKTILECAPNLVVVFGSCAPPVCEYTPLRSAATAIGAHLAFWLHEDPYEFDHHYKFISLADTIFTNDRATIPYYHRNRVFHLPLAASREIHYRNLSNPKIQKAFDIFFCGAAFPNRVHLVRTLEPILKRYRTYICGPGWPKYRAELYHDHRLNYFKLPDYYLRSTIVLNMERRFDLANRLDIKPSTPAPRTFEAAMAGCAQLYLVPTGELYEYFRPNLEIVASESTREVSATLEMLFKDPLLCRQIARNSQRRALQDHTYIKRVQIILQFCLPEYSLAQKARRVED